ncbi:MAG: HEAT repeat domain-containing protein [Leptolyngbyaceae cyanobacterium SM2_5_2]|nr:HEAT repeat domain-containing protein [Leptolyngbyaceae cyanobacterium SM2_5_2]
MGRVRRTNISLAVGLLTLGSVLTGEGVAASERSSVPISRLALGDVDAGSAPEVLATPSRDGMVRPHAAMVLASTSAPASEETAPPDGTSHLRRWGVVGLLGLSSLVGAGLWWRRRQASSRPTTPRSTATLAEEQNPQAADFYSSATRPNHPSDPPPGPGAGLVSQMDETSRLSPLNIAETLIEELASADASVRHRAIWELGQRGNSSAIQPLVNGLLEADSQEKSLILAALAEISSRSLKPMHRALALGLQDPSPEVRKNAIRDLSRVYDTAVQLSQMLVHATQDPDLEVQETARWALGQLNRIRATPYPEALPLSLPMWAIAYPPAP